MLRGTPGCLAMKPARSSVKTKWHRAPSCRWRWCSTPSTHPLTIAIGLMNAYNRLAIGFRVPPKAALF
jgi:hypothetical protein